MSQVHQGKKIRLLKNTWLCRLEDSNHECLLFCCKGDTFKVVEILSDYFKVESRGFLFKINKNEMSLYEVLY